MTAETTITTKAHRKTVRRKKLKTRKRTKTPQGKRSVCCCVPCLRHVTGDGSGCSCCLQVVVPGAGEHPLQYNYTFWYSRRTPGRPASTQSYEQNIKQIGSFASVRHYLGGGSEGLASFLTHYPKSSPRRWNSSGVSTVT